MMPTKILVVDDEPDMAALIQQRFLKRVQDGTYLFEFAQSGEQALDLMSETTDYDVLLLDIRMPGMSGLTLLGHVAEQLPHSRAVMVSAFGDMNNIRTAMNLGAFDFVTKPINFKDLELTINKTARQVAQLRESAHVKAIAGLKARFFDNITHEFRTPLTLVLAPVERLLRQWAPDDEQWRDLHTINRNARHLLQLINQLLDLARLEAGHLPIDNKPGYLTDFVDQLVQNIVPLAEQKGLTIRYESDVVGLWLFDAEKLSLIIYNLVANAIKFTPSPNAAALPDRSALVVQLSAGPPLTFTVSDPGAGISEAALPYVFDRFYQASSEATARQAGTGIGLSLVKELTTLLGGSVSIQSQTASPANSQSGTTIAVLLPLTPLSADADLPNVDYLTDWTWLSPPLISPVSVPINQAADVPTVVIAEDNDDLRLFLTTELTPHYRVLPAATGLEAWQLIESELPDVVLSDVMMPGLSGFDLTQQIKTTPLTEHIAVILLTAKTGDANRLAGLQLGADDYLTKPFLVDELHLRLRNLLARQQHLRVLYSQQLTQPANPDFVPSAETPWLQSLYAVLDKNLDNSSLSVEQVAERMAMSRRTLLRKLQALTQLSPAELIRTYRLKRAAELLRAGHSVTTTAYQVGFETPSYFSLCFKEQYQISPSDYVRSS